MNARRLFGGDIALCGQQLGELNGSFVDLLADGVPTVELAGSLELAPYEVRYLLRA